MPVHGPIICAAIVFSSRTRPCSLGHRHCPLQPNPAVIQSDSAPCLQPGSSQAPAGLMAWSLETPLSAASRYAEQGDTTCLPGRATRTSSHRGLVSRTLLALHPAPPRPAVRSTGPSASQGPLVWSLWFAGLSPPRPGRLSSTRPAQTPREPVWWRPGRGQDSVYHDGDKAKQRRGTKQ